MEPMDPPLVVPIRIDRTPLVGMGWGRKEMGTSFSDPRPPPLGRSRSEREGEKGGTQGVRVGRASREYEAIPKGKTHIV